MPGVAAAGSGCDEHIAAEIGISKASVCPSSSHWMTRVASHNVGVNIWGHIGVRAIAVMPWPKLWSAMYRETEGHGMSLIQNRRGFLGAVFSALLALALFDPGTATAQEVVKQIKLTDKHIQNFMAAYEDIAKLYDGAESDKPEDPKVEALAAAVAKKNGFASLAQYDDVLTNITMIMSGIDPQTKKFTEPPEQVKNEIAALKADKSVPEADKKEGLAQLETALKNAKPIQFKENIALVLKYFDQLAPFMQAQDSDLRPADFVYSH
jgi:hypothetical protein